MALLLLLLLCQLMSPGGSRLLYSSDCLVSTRNWAIASMSQRNLLSRLPPWFSHWLGYRATPPPVTPVYIVWLWSFIGTFCGLSIIQAILIHGHPFTARHVPILIASYVCVLLRYPISLPLWCLSRHCCSITSTSLPNLLDISGASTKGTGSAFSAASQSSGYCFEASGC